MALTASQKSFIENVAAAALKYYPTYKILPSFTIAQACLESGYGSTGLAKECYNFFGMKWTTSCGTEYKVYSTKEQDSHGKEYTINAKFRKYSGYEAGIKGYYDFLNYARYSNLRGVTDYKKVCTLIRTDGWATDVNYTSKLIKIIETYGLTAYDNQALGTATAQPSVSNDTIKNVQKWIKEYTGFNITIDGEVGRQTTQGLIMALQKAINECKGTDLTVDGKFGPMTLAACPVVSQGMDNNLAKVVQAILYCYGFNPQEFSGNFNADCAAAVYEFQNTYPGLVKDKKFGPKCFDAIF